MSGPQLDIRREIEKLREDLYASADTFGSRKYRIELRAVADRLGRILAAAVEGNPE